MFHYESLDKMRIIIVVFMRQFFHDYTNIFDLLYLTFSSRNASS